MWVRFGPTMKCGYFCREMWVHKIWGRAHRKIFWKYSYFRGYGLPVWGSVWPSVPFTLSPATSKEEKRRAYAWFKSDIGSNVGHCCDTRVLCSVRLCGVKSAHVVVKLMPSHSGPVEGKIRVFLKRATGRTKFEFTLFWTTYFSEFWVRTIEPEMTV